MKKKVLVYPCGTEIGLEIHRSVSDSTHFELYGGSSTYDHGRFVYENHIDHLPFITDDSTMEEVKEFNSAIAQYKFDFIYPAMDGVIYKFAQYRDVLTPILIAPDFETVEVTRSKKKSYQILADVIEVPRCYSLKESISCFPVFMKPDVGQGSKDAKMINSFQELSYELGKHPTGQMLLLEYLPGEEYTVDCFTNEEGKLLYAGGRTRKRIKGGISVNAVQARDCEFWNIAEIINSKLNQRGGWFFQLKKNSQGRYSLLEVASRIAGASSYTRNLGVNLPLLTLHLYNNNKIDSVMINDYHIEMDRAFYNKFKNDICYRQVYVDYDDTLIVHGKVNLRMVSFLYQCINEGVKLTLLTKHEGDLDKDLKDKRLSGVFDEVIHLKQGEEKLDYIKNQDAIFIDDSYGERFKVKSSLGIPVFDTHMLECLQKEIG